MSNENTAINDDFKPVLEGGEEKETPDQGSGLTDYILMSSQVVLLLIWTYCCKYGEVALPNSTAKPLNSNIYPCFQDINVMIFIGFGYLMTYIKAGG